MENEKLTRFDLYGNGFDLLCARVGEIEARRIIDQYKTNERRRKASDKKRRAAIRRERLGGLPDYQDTVLAHMEAWIAARKAEGGGRISLDDVFDAWKHAAHKVGLEDYRRVGAKGFAMALRAHGVKTVRYGTGIMVDGIDV